MRLENVWTQKVSAINKLQEPATPYGGLLFGVVQGPLVIFGNETKYF